MSIRSLLLLLAVCVVLAAGGAVWQWDCRARRAHATMRMLMDSEATIFEIRRVFPRRIDRNIPDWVERRYPHLFRTPTSVQFFPQSYSPKPDLAALKALPQIEQVEIVDSRVTAPDLAPLKSLRSLKRLSLCGTRVGRAELPAISRELPGVAIQYVDVFLGIGHPTE